MAKIKTTFVCRACGAHYAKWMGQCTACGEWNTVEERIEAGVDRRARPPSGASLVTRTLADIHADESPRLGSGIGEWDRVLGGGIVPGSVILVGGDPGVGKSTLLMQVADAIARAPQSSSFLPGGGGPGRVGVLYVSGEESLPQIGLRARRLGLAANGTYLSAETDVSAI